VNHSHLVAMRQAAATGAAGTAWRLTIERAGWPGALTRTFTEEAKARAAFHSEMTAEKAPLVQLALSERSGGDWVKRSALEPSSDALRRHLRTVRR
jgi:hypothetical protein